MELQGTTKQAEIVRAEQEVGQLLRELTSLELSLVGGGSVTPLFQ